MIDDNPPLRTGPSAASATLSREDAATLLRRARNATPPERSELTELALAHLPDSRAALRLRCRTLLEEGDLEQAKTYLTRGLLIWPGDVPLSELRARFLTEQGRLAEAESEISRVLTLRPWRAGAVLLAARIALERSDPNRAIQLILDLLERMQGDRECVILLARARLAAGQPAQAVTALRSMESPPPLLLARALRAADQPLDAAALLRATLHQHHDTAERDAQLAELLEVSEELGDRQTITTLAADLRPSDVQATLMMCRIELARGEFAAALRRAFPLRRNRNGQAAALGVVMIAASFLSREQLAERCLRRLRMVRHDDNPSIVAACWRRAIIGSMIREQHHPRRAGADPDSSVLGLLLRRAGQTFRNHLRAIELFAADASEEPAEVHRMLTASSAMLREETLQATARPPRVVSRQAA